MKILKFNEEYDHIRISEEYIEDCFVDLYDKYGEDIFIYYDHDDLYFSVDITINIDDSGDYGYNESTMVSITKTLSELMEMASYAMDKVKIKYIDMKPFYDFYKRNNDQGTYHFSIYSK